jgi:hypothetical protein
MPETTATEVALRDGLHPTNPRSASDALDAYQCMMQTLRQQVDQRLRWPPRWIGETTTFTPVLIPGTSLRFDRVAHEAMEMFEPNPHRRTITVTRNPAWATFDVEVKLSTHGFSVTSFTDYELNQYRVPADAKAHVMERIRDPWYESL